PACATRPSAPCISNPGCRPRYARPTLAWPPRPAKKPPEPPRPAARPHPDARASSPHRFPGAAGRSHVQTEAPALRRHDLAVQELVDAGAAGAVVAAEDRVRSTVEIVVAVAAEQLII